MCLRVQCEGVVAGDGLQRIVDLRGQQKSSDRGGSSDRGWLGVWARFCDATLGVGGGG